MTAPDIYAVIKAELEAAENPDELRAKVLSRLGSGGAADAWRPGEVPDNSLDARFRRAVATNPEAVLSGIRRTHPPASVKISGSEKVFWITLGDNQGTITVTWQPGKG